MLKKFFIIGFFLFSSIYFSGCVTKDNNYFTNAKYRKKLQKNYRLSHRLDKGIVISNILIEVKEGGTGGSIIGTIIGGVIGSQFGKNSGKMIMIATGTIAGGTIGYLLSENKIVKQKITIRSLTTNNIYEILVPISYEHPKKDLIKIGEKIQIEMKKNSNYKPLRIKRLNKGEHFLNYF